MQRVSLEIYTTAYEAVKILENVVDHKVELEIPAGSVLLDNILNLKIIAEGAKKSGKSVDFVTPDFFGQNLIKILKGESDEMTAKETEVPARIPQTAKTSGFKLKLPVVGLPRFGVGLNFKKLALMISVLLILLLGLGFLYLGRAHKAKIMLHFSPQNLTKSVTVKVGDGLKTDIDKKVLAGLKVTRTLDHSAEIVSTGTKLEGNKAKGKVTLYNSTEDEVTLKKGTVLTYKKSDDSYVFAIDVEVKIPARTDSAPPDTTITKGTAEVNVTAESIGEAYNLKKEREFSVKGYKSSQLTASNAADFKGGSSEEIIIVTQADITKLTQELTTYVSTNPSEVLRNAVASGFSFVDKSAIVASKNVIINNKAGDEKDKLSGSITAQIEGLTYSKTELADFMGKLSQNLVPTGFEFYSYSKDISVEVLGNTEKTVLSPTEADLQVTFRFFIAPKIDEEKVFGNISGKSPTEAAEILKAINGVEDVDLSVYPNFPLFNTIPTRTSAVEIETKIGD